VTSISPDKKKESEIADGPFPVPKKNQEIVKISNQITKFSQFTAKLFFLSLATRALEKRFAILTNRTSRSKIHA
jgi:hypothetical protein